MRSSVKRVRPTLPNDLIVGCKGYQVCKALHCDRVTVMDMRGDRIVK